MKSGTGAGVGRASYPRGFIEPHADLSQVSLIIGSTNCAFIAANSFVATTHASRADEVEQKQQLSAA